jgi:hypothetical protein
VADPFCPNCGTEVDEDARFCPTCGRTLLLDESAEEPDEPAAFPPAPVWPPPEHSSAPEPPTAAPGPPEVAEEPTAARSAPASSAPAPVPPPPEASVPPAVPARTAPDLPFTWPATLGGWLVGAGSGLAALALLPRLGNPLDLVLFVALLGISATVFIADRLPRIAHQRLIVRGVLMLGLGVALERAAFTVRGIHTVFLITMLVAAGGAILIELDRDRPLPPPGGSG